MVYWTKIACCDARKVGRRGGCRSASPCGCFHRHEGGDAWAGAKSEDEAFAAVIRGEALERAHGPNDPRPEAEINGQGGDAKPMRRNFDPGANSSFRATEAVYDITGGGEVSKHWTFRPFVFLAYTD